MSEPRCYHCGHLLAHIDAWCPVCCPSHNPTEGTYEANAMPHAEMKAEIDRLKAENADLTVSMMLYRETADAWKAQCDRYRKALEAIRDNENVGTNYDSTMRPWNCGCRGIARKALEGKD